jgi:hypothetical protein
MSCDESLGTNRVKVHPTESVKTPVVSLCCHCIKDPEVREKWEVID